MPWRPRGWGCFSGTSANSHHPMGLGFGRAGLSTVLDPDASGKSTSFLRFACHICESEFGLLFMLPLKFCDSFLSRVAHLEHFPVLSSVYYKMTCVYMSLFGFSEFFMGKAFQNYFQKGMFARMACKEAVTPQATHTHTHHLCSNVRIQIIAFVCKLDF